MMLPNLENIHPIAFQMYAKHPIKMLSKGKHVSLKLMEQ